MRSSTYYRRINPNEIKRLPFIQRSCFIREVEDVNEFGVSDMQHHRSVACPASQHAGNLGMIFTAVGMGAAHAAVNGAMAVRHAREASASQTLAYQLRQAVDATHEWADLAKAQAAEIEKLKADNVRLRRVAKAHNDTAQALARKAA